MIEMTSKLRATRTFACTLLAGLGFSLVPTAEAAFTITMREVGSDVVATGSGSINTAGFTSSTSSSFHGMVLPSAWIVVAPTSTMMVTAYQPLTGPTSIGPGTTQVNASSGSGDGAGVDFSSGGIGVPQGYVSGAPLSGTSLWNGTTLAGLGVTPGTYVWSWGSGENADSFTLIVQQPTVGVPTLSQWGLMTMLALVGLAGLHALRRQV